MSDLAIPLSRRLVAEGLGTALLVATIVGSGIMAERLAGGNQAVALLGNTIPTGAILIVLITILGPISGAHLNPAVTFIFAVRGTTPWTEVIPYVLAQCLCGIAGTALAHLMFDLAPLVIGTTVRSGPSQWLAEAVATFTLILTILGGLRYAPQSIPWLVGLVITAAYWFTSSTSFANPAVTLARGFTTTFAGIAINHVPAFVAAQIMGALMAAVVASCLFPSARNTDGIPSPHGSERWHLWSESGIGCIAHVDNRQFGLRKKGASFAHRVPSAIERWCSDQHGTAVHDDHLPRAVGFLHQIKIGLSEIVSLANAADRKPARGFRYIASRSASGISLQSSVLTAPGQTALTLIGASRRRAHGSTLPSRRKCWLPPSNPCGGAARQFHWST